ncbi:hypothetical protein FIBSPDRAFT_851488 [Athelia psychrophila]|uniref:Ricin B lectin domain-containing protein n=1 Tax=Athelia psychrophila TaxID=1759441 RepID=A0A166SIJ4_9AGAM|nr:hypothetical protein FIBSPDRAFT_851488 [Fibularhizoctonia sp. CBS 109695]
MSLPSGYYLIKHQRSNKNVSRYRIEDKSLNPKRVLVLPDSTDSYDDPVWIIESSGDGNYHFTNRGGAASVINGNIYCNILRSEGNDVWQVKPGPGPNVFQITNSEGLNWSVNNTDDYSQIATSPSPDFFVITPCQE